MFSAAKIVGLPQERHGAVHTGATAESQVITGNNYWLDVTVSGAIDPKTGIIVNIKDIDAIVREHVVQVFDKKLINSAVPEFMDAPVTAETLVLYIVSKLMSTLPSMVELVGIRLEEAPLQWVEWRSRDAPGPPKENSMQSTRVYEFAASHRLHSPHLTEEQNVELFGKCNYIHGHGHNYVLEVTVAGPIDSCTGQVIDGELMDSIVNREVVDRYDHKHFNHDMPEFEGLIPSSEIITKVIWERLNDKVPAPARLDRVLLRETARNIFEYRGGIDGF